MCCVVGVKSTLVCVRVLMDECASWFVLCFAVVRGTVWAPRRGVGNDGGQTCNSGKMCVVCTIVCGLVCASVCAVSMIATIRVCIYLYSCMSVCEESAWTAPSFFLAYETYKLYGLLTIVLVSCILAWLRELACAHSVGHGPACLCASLGFQILMQLVFAKHRCYAILEQILHVGLG